MATEKADLGALASELAKEVQPRPDWMHDTTPQIIGVNRRSYPGPHSRTTVIVVLCLGSINDYAAYAATTHDEAWARLNGDKLSFEEACVHFPGGQLVKERYRK